MQRRCDSGHNLVEYDLSVIPTLSGLKKERCQLYDELLSESPSSGILFSMYSSLIQVPGILFLWTYRVVTEMGRLF